MSFSKLPEWVIRRAVAADAVAIEGLYRELVDDVDVCVLPDQVRQMGESERSILLVAEVEGLVCGTVLLTICADAMYRAQPFGVIENLVVASSHRKQGMGRALLDRVEQLILERDGSKLMLLSSVRRPEAHALFRECGFAEDTKRAFVKYRRQFRGPAS